MTLPPRLRRTLLLAHIASSVGWLGAVVAYIALDVTAVASGDEQLVLAAYLAMELTVRWVIVPLALATVVIGLLTALGTPWGLVRHHWVVVKLLLTLLATAVLLAETPTIGSLADAARTVADPRGLPGSLPHSLGGLVVLLLVLALSVYKPKGVTRYGWRKQQEQRRPPRSVTAGAR